MTTRVTLSNDIPFYVFKTTESSWNDVFYSRVVLIPHGSFIQANFYSASSSPLLLRGAPDTAGILCRSFTPKRHRQLRVKDLPKVPAWRIERDCLMMSLFLISINHEKL